MGRTKNEDGLAERVASAAGAAAKIAEAMSGVQWDAELCNQIADILHDAGMKIPDPDPNLLPPACCPAPGCGRRDQLVVTETVLMTYPYDAKRHEAELEGDVQDRFQNYRAKCEACGMDGPLDAFKMKLVGWVGDDDDGEED